MHLGVSLSAGDMEIEQPPRFYWAASVESALAALSEHEVVMVNVP
jgi:hypothetical protein